MKTIRVTAEITYDDTIMYDENDQEAKQWFDGILKGNGNLIHSNEIGDTLGDIKILSIIGND